MIEYSVLVISYRQSAVKIPFGQTDDCIELVDSLQRAYNSL